MSLVSSVDRHEITSRAFLIRVDTITKTVSLVDVSVKGFMFACVRLSRERDSVTAAMDQNRY